MKGGFNMPVIVDYQVIFNLFVELIKFAFPISCIFGLGVTLCNIVFDMIFPTRKRGGYL